MSDRGQFILRQIIAGELLYESIGGILVDNKDNLLITPRLSLDGCYSI